MFLVTDNLIFLTTDNLLSLFDKDWQGFWVSVIIACSYWYAVSTRDKWRGFLCPSLEKDHANLQERVRTVRRLNFMCFLHNGLLSVASGVLFVIMAAEIGQMWPLSNGLFDLTCDERNLWNNPNTSWIYTLYWYNAYMKYWELLDTFFLIMKPQPISSSVASTTPATTAAVPVTSSFVQEKNKNVVEKENKSKEKKEKKDIKGLHWYHHGIVLVLVHSQMLARTAIQWVPIMINLFIHVIMYAYFARHSFGQVLGRVMSKPSWAGYITWMQVMQFVIGLVWCIYSLLSTIMYDLGYTNWERCQGEYYAGFTGLSILFSFLFLFWIELKPFRELQREKKIQTENAKQRKDKNNINNKPGCLEVVGDHMVAAVEEVHDTFGKVTSATQGLSPTNH